MNNEIKEDYCSYEVSMLLKDAGFDCKCRSYFKESKRRYEYDYYVRSSMFSDFYVSAPTHSLALKWLWENYNIWIFVNIDKQRQVRFLPTAKSPDGTTLFFGAYKTPYDAIEAALKECLKRILSAKQTING